LQGALVAGRYKLTQLIGRGGFGSVHAALDTQSGDHVALKTLHASNDASARARFSREAAICARLGCPSTVRLLDHGEHEGAPFIVYELLDGESLATALARGPLPEERALAITRAILASLAEAHRAGVVHRDVKPANVFLTRDGRTKLLDFGIATSLAPATGRGLTATGEIVGTPPYLAPEQLTGGAITPATDLYAVALVLAEMLSGKRVFDEPPLAIMARKARAAAPPFDSALLLSRLGNLLLGASAKDPSARFQSAEMMLGALNGPGPRKATRLYMLIALGTLALVGGVTALLLLRAQGPSEAARESAKRKYDTLRHCPGADALAPITLRTRYPRWTARYEVEGYREETIYKHGDRQIGSITVYTSPESAKRTKKNIEDGAKIAPESTADMVVGDKMVWHINLPAREAADLIQELCR
jgi:hypothetical protein